jgi:benzoyl-CoA reductase/2-hydroxyglutaryl-CoA dehydratase subunit BcrC/BadD/HgdB
LPSGSWLRLGAAPWVLMTGSPVLFPNEKLPLLLEESGLYLADWVDAVSIQTELDPGAVPHFASVPELLRQLMASRLAQNASGAFAVNTGLCDALREHLERVPVDGIIYHVLKGHIEADFELPRVEALAEELGLPLIRVETDYQQQDVEQLRIRMEAFGEMLRQRRHEGVRIAL